MIATTDRGRSVLVSGRILLGSGRILLRRVDLPPTGSISRHCHDDGKGSLCAQGSEPSRTFIDVTSKREGTTGLRDAEHGIGTEKKAYLGLSRSKNEIELMKKLN